MAKKTSLDTYRAKLLSIALVSNSIRDVFVNEEKYFLQAKEIEKQQRIRDYNIGYQDAQCNHINDAENLAAEFEYLQSKIDNIDNMIKDKQNNIADLLINNFPENK